MYFKGYKKTLKQSVKAGSVILPALTANIRFLYGATFYEKYRFYLWTAVALKE